MIATKRLKRKEEVIIEFKYIASLIRVLNEYRVLGEKKYLNIVIGSNGYIVNAYNISNDIQNIIFKI